jgi:hypothetical protein
MSRLPEQFFDKQENSTGSDIITAQNPYRNVAYLLPRQIEQVLLADFCPDELAMNLKPRSVRPS